MQKNPLLHWMYYMRCVNKFPTIKTLFFFLYQFKSLSLGLRHTQAQGHQECHEGYLNKPPNSIISPGGHPKLTPLVISL